MKQTQLLPYLFTALLILAGGIFIPHNAFGQEKSDSGKNGFDTWPGYWHIKNWRLKNPTDPLSSEKFDAYQVAHSTLNGFGNRDHFYATIDGEYYEGMSLRLYDEIEDLWRIYWIDSNGGGLGKPTSGTFKDGKGDFRQIRKLDNGMDLTLQYLWKFPTKDSARWENAWSIDGGENWSTTWTMTINRIPKGENPHKPESLPEFEGIHDFDWHLGEWEVKNWRLKNPQDPGSAQEFTAHAKVEKYLTGLGLISTFTAEIDGEPFEGNNIRVFDTTEKKWSLYWVDTNSHKELINPVVGSFENGIGNFYRSFLHSSGATVILRSRFYDIEKNTAKWSMAFSSDGGGAWTETWTMEFRRK